ncbi:nuclear transport factor 2 family protein [Mesorhizobium sp. 1B3]|uniref:nuclear transport factor 2 family protein n=1 Tax=Mesorhizobium sp. 1B3 TaxID=3243599 RepID=UPI003D98F157
METLGAEQRAAIEQACIRLSNAFATYLDTKRYEDVVALFTDDARYRPRDHVYIGHEGVRAYLSSRPENRRSRHVISNHLVEVVTPNEARGRCVIVYYADESGAPEGRPAPLAGPRLVADYVDRFVLTETGWRIAERICEVQFDHQADGAS